MGFSFFGLGFQPLWSVIACERYVLFAALRQAKPRTRAGDGVNKSPTESPAFLLRKSLNVKKMPSEVHFINTYQHTEKVLVCQGEKSVISKKRFYKDWGRRPIRRFFPHVAVTG